MLRAVTAAAATTYVLHTLTKQERTKDPTSPPSVVGFAQKLLPSFGVHLVKVGDRTSVVLDSHKDIPSLEDIPTVVMLHGFPDNALYFYKVARVLEENDYRVILPSLPGYDSTSVTGKMSDKDHESLARHILAVLDKLGLDTFHLVGHDWGALFAAQIGMDHPERLMSLTMSAVPHNVPLGIQRFPRQLLFSWYFALMQLPFVPELWLNKFAGLKWIWNSWSPGVSQRCERLFWESVLATFKQPGVANDAVNYYRRELGGGFLISRLLFPYVMVFGYVLGLLMRKKNYKAAVTQQEMKMTKLFNMKPIGVRTLGLAGEKDGCMMPEMTEFLYSKNAGTDVLFPKGCEFSMIPDAGHFSFIDNPEEVSRVLLEWLEQSNIPSM